MNRSSLPALLACALLAIPFIPMATAATPLPGSTGCTEHQSPNPRPAAWFSLGKPADDFDDGCFHQFMVNQPDSATIDVAILPQPGIEALRDANLVRASAKMWETGLKAGAHLHGLDWLVDGMHINPYVVGEDVPSIGDPDIVVLLQDAGPAAVTWAYAGVGMDSPLTAPCAGGLPLDASSLVPDAVRNAPGFDGHDGNGWGNLAADCGAGGRVCFVVGAVAYDLPSDDMAHNVYDLMSHEFGHCLGLGHVGDASDFGSRAYPADDIMSYEQDGHEPPYALCVSNLDLKTFAYRYQPLIDGAPALGYTADSAGYITMEGGSDPVNANNDGIQDPLPASSWRVFKADGTESRSAADCPQPDTALVQLPPVLQSPSDPGGGSGGSPAVTIGSPANGTTDQPASLTVNGTVDRAAGSAPASALPATDSAITGSLFAYNACPSTLPAKCPLSPGVSNIVALATGLTGDSVPKYPGGTAVALSARNTVDTQHRIDQATGGHAYLFAADGTVVAGPFDTTGFDESKQTPAGSGYGYQPAGNIDLPTPAGRYYLGISLQVAGAEHFITDTSAKDPSGLKPIDIVAPPAPPAAAGSGQSTDPTGDSQVPGTDITGFGIVPGSETASTFQVHLDIADLASAPPGAVDVGTPLGSIPTGASTQYTVDFNDNEPTASNGKMHYQVYAETFTANTAGGPTHAFALNVVGAGTTNFVSTVRAVDGVWDTAANTITWTVPKAAMVVTTAPTGATDAGAMTGAAPPVAGRILDTFTAEVRTWAYAVVGVGPSAAIWDSGDGGSASYTFTGGSQSATVPGAPASLAATPGDGSASLAWSAPSTDGGAAIDSYTVHYGTATGTYTATQTATGPSTTVTGLTNGQPYYFAVTAHNSVGDGALSTEATATPAAASATGERVELWEGTAMLGSPAAVATSAGTPTAAWSIPLTGLASGSHLLTAKWFDQGVASTGTPLATAQVAFTVAAATTTTTTTTATTSSTSGTDTNATSTEGGSAGGNVNNVAPQVDSFAASPGVAVIGHDGSVALSGVAHDDNGQDDVTGVTLTMYGPGSNGPSTVLTAPARTLSSSDDKVVLFAGNTSVSAATAVGTYQVDAFAQDEGGLQSAVKSTTFTVLPPPAVGINYTGSIDRLDFGSFDPGAHNVTSVNAARVVNEMHGSREFFFDMSDFVCSVRGGIPVAGHATILIGQVDASGAFVSQSSKPYDQSTFSFGTIADHGGFAFEVELHDVPTAIAGSCSASFGIAHA